MISWAHSVKIPAPLMEGLLPDEYEPLGDSVAIQQAIAKIGDKQLALQVSFLFNICEHGKFSKTLQSSRGGGDTLPAFTEQTVQAMTSALASDKTLRVQFARPSFESCFQAQLPGQHVHIIALDGLVDTQKLMAAATAELDKEKMIWFSHWKQMLVDSATDIVQPVSPIVRSGWPCSAPIATHRSSNSDTLAN